ncbi:GNAT family N-acetyltransferase [Actinoplanes sp. CA-051413]|uniref:GNAT family N-acetyltransferase n=1 Tax=Actinoplanes sp. CA-051413 TaxID=3239899 RepID=UPI003D98E2A4
MELESPLPSALASVICPLLPEHIPLMSKTLGRGHAKYFRKHMPLQRSKRGIVLVALHHDRPVGGLFVLREPADERIVRQELPGVPILHQLWVKEDMRRRTIGTQLLKAAHEQLREFGHSHVALGVDVHNKDAIRLYERLGYERLEGRRWGQRMVAGRSFREQPERPTAYELMVLDLQNNDRTRFWGPPTSWRNSQPVRAAFSARITQPAQ